MNRDEVLVPPAEEWTVASQAVLVRLLTRLAQSDSKLRVLVAQALEDTARALEIIASCEDDRESRAMYARAASAVEQIHDWVFDVTDASNSVQH